MNMDIPADTILLADAGVGISNAAGAKLYHGIYCGYNSFNLLKPSNPVVYGFAGGGYSGVFGLHNARANVAWYDGHVSAELVYSPPAAIAALNPPPRPALANTLVNEHVGYISPYSGDYATVFSQNPQAGYYYWLIKNFQY